MKLIRVKIDNYKSFGESQNVLYVNDLNTVIGKNESGKSNLIDLLEAVGYIGASDDEIFMKNNKKSEKPVKVQLVYETQENEDFFCRDYKGEVSISLEGEETYKINKEFGEYIVSRPTYILYMKKISALKDKAPITRPENISKLSEIIDKFKKVNEEIFIEPDFFRTFVDDMKEANDIKIGQLMSAIEKLYNFLENIYFSFPAFLKIENIEFKDKYTIGELKDELEEYNYDSVLYQLFDVCGINSQKLIETMEKNETSRIRSCEDDIQKLINKNFIKKFNEFYSQELVKLVVDINTDSFDLMIKTIDGAYLDYTERSNGLRWYISIFIQLLYKRKHSAKSTSCVLLLDEPGVYLHANAQKELRKLLRSLAGNGEQIIYTTHSPFMIDKDDLLSIRTLIKDDEGYTHIHNKITNVPIESKSRYEAITPLLYALGCEGAYDIEPSYNMCNIITEGITDYYCLVGFNECLGKDIEYKIIPSNGGNDIPAIANILFGWRCEFVILLDQDEKGREVYQSLRDKKSPFIDRVLFINGAKEYNPDIEYEIEDVFSNEDKEEFGFNRPEYEGDKYNYVTAMLTKIKCGDTKYSKETMNNFKNLIDEIEKVRSLTKE